MDNNSDHQLLIVQATIEANRKYYDDKIKNITEDLIEIITSIVDQIKFYKSSPYKKDSSKAHYNAAVVPAKRRATTLEGRHSTKICFMWTLKHDISSPKFYELLIKIELKGDTALDLKNLYNHINMYLNAVTRLR